MFEIKSEYYIKYLQLEGSKSRSFFRNTKVTHMSREYIRFSSVFQNNNL